MMNHDGHSGVGRPNQKGMNPRLKKNLNRKDRQDRKGIEMQFGTLIGLFRSTQISNRSSTRRRRKALLRKNAESKKQEFWLNTFSR